MVRDILRLRTLEQEMYHEQRLAAVGQVPAPPRLVVHGGGLTGLPELTRAILAAVGLPWVELAGDATQLGCYLVGRGLR